MGLKTKNYTLKKSGITLPEAYAAITKCEIYGTQGTAYIGIHQTRADALHKEPLEVVPIRFELNRDEHPYKTAYKHAKDFEELENGETVPMPFNGWTDDIH